MMTFDKEVEIGLENAKIQVRNFDIMLDLVDLAVVWVGERAIREARLRAEDVIGKHIDEVTKMPDQEYNIFLRKLILGLENTYCIRVQCGDGAMLSLESEHHLIEIMEGRPRFIAIKLLSIKEDYGKSELPETRVASAMNRLIAREGLIFAVIISFGAVLLFIGGNIAILGAGIVILGYPSYLLGRFIIWAVRTLLEK
jgi:hypothetical protein